MASPDYAINATDSANKKGRSNSGLLVSYGYSRRVRSRATYRTIGSYNWCRKWRALHVAETPETIALHRDRDRIRGAVIPVGVCSSHAPRGSSSALMYSSFNQKEWCGNSCRNSCTVSSASSRSDKQYRSSSTPLQYSTKTCPVNPISIPPVVMK